MRDKIFHMVGKGGVRVRLSHIGKRNGGTLAASIRRRGFVTAAVCVTVLGVLFAAMFRLYQRQNERLFHALACDNLLTLHQKQAASALDSIRAVCGALEAAASAYGISGDAPRNEWSAAYFQAISEQYGLYGAGYCSLAQLQGLAANPGAPAGVGAAAETLLAGRSVVSDVWGSSRLDGVSVFTVAVPLLAEGRVTGALCSLLRADLLLQTATPSNGETNNYLVGQDGGVLLGPGGYVGGGADLCGELGMAGPQAAQLRGLLGLPSGSLHLSGGAFLCATSLGYNGWVLVSYTGPGYLAGYSGSIWQNTALLAAILLSALVLIAGASFWAYRAQRNSILRSQTHYDILARFSDTILLEYDCRAQTVTMSANISEQYPFPPGHVVRPFDEAYQFLLLHPSDVAPFQNSLHAALDMAEGEARSLELRLRTKEGDYRWMQCQYQLLRDRHGRPLTVFGKLSDIQQQKDKERRLLEKASTDALTGVLNQAATRARITRLLEEGRPGYLLMLDLDDFKRVNDNFGHAAGDQLLTHFARILQGNFRQNDVIGRVGGDEFVVYMTGVSSTQAVCGCVERLLEQIRALQQPASVSSSIGIAAFPRNGATYAQLYEAADRAMYAAKRAGKNRYYFFAS